jgi:uncharacterized protein (TIGR03000 family)
MPFVPPASATQRPAAGFGFGVRQPNVVFAPVALPWGYGYSPYYAPYGGFGYGYGGNIVTQVIVPAQPVITLDPPVGVVTRPQPAVVLANQFPATLTLQFPSSAEVWLNGKKLEGAASDERVLTSPVLKTGERYTFDVKARWTTGGKTYETKRNIALGSGDRSRLLIVSGDEVKE